MSWYKFLEEWRKKNPQVSYREALKKASKDYKKQKESKNQIKRRRMNNPVSFGEDIYLKNILIQHSEEARKNLISIFYSTGENKKEAIENFHIHMKILKDKEHDWRKLNKGKDDENYFLNKIELLEREYFQNERQEHSRRNVKISTRKQKSKGSSRK